MLDVLTTAIATGLLYGMLGFAIVVLFKMTGVPNFAAGSLATLGAVAVYELAVRHHLNLALAITLGLVGLGVLGTVIYTVVMRYRDDAGVPNLTVRTLGLYLLLFALTDKGLGEGQPFSFPRLFPARALTLGPLRLTVADLGVLAIAFILTAAFAWAFRFTRAGLLLRGVAADRETARLLGANVRRLEAASWALTAVLAAVVGILAAPTTLVSAGMMDESLLYVFAAVVIGGLTSLGGAFAGGVTVGVVQGFVHYYGNADLSLLAVFGLFLLTLLVRPYGMFGEPTPERL
ncbi:branched-chain amino acid ABC transporter permease [Actinomadura sp.]|jgi:branched-chain amino acid transport system permease protein|uniref:branched-chain amino acid ABC transporter permease n=1 Tax=Actinomadura sp. TaxID=1989 RepID=UPI00334745A1